MATAQPAYNPETTLEIRRTFKAPREKVFAAWTKAEGLSQWHAPTPEHKAQAQVDLRVGGKYRIKITHAKGAVHTAVGVYREIIEPEKLVYSWSWEDGSVTDTLVTVDFHDRGGATEVVLTHEFMPDQEWRDKHAQGWTGCLAALENYLG